MSKSQFLVMLLASFVVALLPAGAAQATFRASYEVSLSANGGTHSTRSAQTLASNESISHEFGEFEVDLLPVLAADGEYTLQVTVTPIPKESSSVAAPVTMSFPGSLGGTMEFTAQFGAAVVSGAVMLHQVRE